MVEEKEKGQGSRGERRFARFPVSVPVLVHTEQFPGEEVTGVVRNVSVGGLIAEFPREISSATPLRLLLKTRRGPLELEARVVWSAATKTKVRHGLAFIQQQDSDFAINLFIGENR